MDEGVVLPLPQAAQQAPEPASVPNAVPVKIHLLNSKTFVVLNVGAWAYEEMGVFATGHFANQPSVERDLLIPYNRIDYYEFDFDRLNEYVESKRKELNDESAGT